MRRTLGLINDAHGLALVDISKPVGIAFQAAVDKGQACALMSIVVIRREVGTTRAGIDGEQTRI